MLVDHLRGIRLYPVACLRDPNHLNVRDPLLVALGKSDPKMAVLFSPKEKRGDLESRPVT
jgi:hypothetical protein